MKAESAPPQLQRWSCGSGAAVTFPFSPPTSRRGETDLLCAVISSIHPVNLQGSRCRFHVADEETEARQSGMLKSHSKSATEMGVLKIPVALFFKHVLIKTV